MMRVCVRVGAACLVLCEGSGGGEADTSAILYHRVLLYIVADAVSGLIMMATMMKINFL